MNRDNCPCLSKFGSISFDFQKVSAREKYEISIQEIEHNEKQAQVKCEENAVKDKEYQLHSVCVTTLASHSILTVGVILLHT